MSVHVPLLVCHFLRSACLPYQAAADAIGSLRRHRLHGQ